MTLADIRIFEELLRNPSIASSNAAIAVVEELAGSTEPGAFTSNVTMKARTEASYGVAEAKLDQALMDLRLLIREDEEEPLLQAQEAWKTYRSKVVDRALREYLGGSHATLAMVLAGLAETERRTEEIRAEVIDRGSR